MILNLSSDFRILVENKIKMLIVGEHKIKFPKQSDNLTNDELFEFCVINKDLRIERDADLNIIIMAPVGGGSGFSELEVVSEIRNWRRKNSGISFSPSTGFLLPNGAMRAPDASWISNERWATVPNEQKEKFLPVVPNFIVEVRSNTDTLKGTKAKMAEWIENGVQLAWLIDKKNEQTFIYRADGTIEKVTGFDKKLSGEEILKGFELDLSLLIMP